MPVTPPPTVGRLPDGSGWAVFNAQGTPLWSRTFATEWAAYEALSDWRGLVAAHRQAYRAQRPRAAGSVAKASGDHQDRLGNLLSFLRLVGANKP